MGKQRVPISKNRGKEEVNMSDISTDFEQNMLMKYFSKTDDIEKDMRKIIESSRDTAYRAVNTILVQRNWLIGRSIWEPTVCFLTSLVIRAKSVGTNHTGMPFLLWR